MPDTYVAKPRGSTQHLKQNKRLRKFTKRTLWRDNLELEIVGRALVSAVVEPNFSAPANVKQSMSIEEAFDTVSVWKARAKSGEGLPHAVESTYHLAHVYWRDRNHLNTNNISTTELRLSYSSAIVRTINGFADVLQQQRFVASSVSLLCSKLGIPAWIVDIRHEASHNALPSLGVLRLATCTLMEFLKTEYWIPMCDEWKIVDGMEDGESETAGDHQNVKPEKKEAKKLPIDYLLTYKACATTFFSPQLIDDKTSKKGGDKSNSKQQAAALNLSFDPLFGDPSSDDDDWEDPVLGSIRGNYIGTSSNRFALLEPPTAKSSKEKNKAEKSKKKKKGNSNSQPTPKKKPGEKYPIDHAKDFVSSVSPQDGFSTALMFLVYGGIGGSPAGRGVLIPGSTSAFPATEKGVLKSWKRYSPLLQVLGRVWPGFCSCLLVNLVDFVLSIEDSVINGHGQTNGDGSSLDPGSARKLFFLSAWIRLLLSEQFISSIDPTFGGFKTANNKKNGSIELSLAELSYLQKLGYPLNSIADRCTLLTSDTDLRSTSQDILRTLKEILGESRVPNFGLSTSPPLEVARPVEGPSIPSHLQNQPSVSSDHDAESSVSSHDEAHDVLGEGVEGPSLPLSSTNMPGSPQYEERQNEDLGENPATSAAGVTGMSLDEMEALLSEPKPSPKPIEDEESNVQQSNEMEALEAESQKRPFNNDHTMDDSSIHHKPKKRMAWIKCSAWDSCSLGTLPGHPI